MALHKAAALERIDGTQWSQGYTHNFSISELPYFFRKSWKSQQIIGSGFLDRNTSGGGYTSRWLKNCSCLTRRKNRMSRLSRSLVQGQDVDAFSKEPNNLKLMSSFVSLVHCWARRPRLGRLFPPCELCVFALVAGLGRSKSKRFQDHWFGRHIFQTSYDRIYRAYMCTCYKLEVISCYLKSLAWLRPLFLCIPWLLPIKHLVQWSWRVGRLLSGTGVAYRCRTFAPNV